MTFDLPTLFAMTLVNFTIASIAAFFIWYVNRPVQGLSLIFAGVLVAGCGFGLVFSRPFYPKAGILLGNFAMISGLFLILNGIRIFRGMRPLRMLYAVAITLPVLVCYSYFLFIDDRVSMRTMTLAPFSAALCFAAAWAMGTRVAREDRVVYWGTAAGLALYGCTQLLKTGLALSPEASRYIFAGRVMEVVSLFTMNVSVIICMFGLSTATNLKLRRKIEAWALSDALTGLPNRRCFDERLEQSHQRSIATGSPIALIYIDLDEFKAVNDLYGHQAGDVVLQTVANCLRGAVGAGDCLARLGGDEFVVLSENIRTRQEAGDLVSRLQDCIRDSVRVKGHAVDLTISCGFALFPADVASASDLMREADAEMYAMKRRVSAAH